MDSLKNLAIFGGTPAFPEKRFVNRPNLGNREIFHRHVEEILDSRWFTNDGPRVRELEARLAQFLQVEHCVLTCNGTAALSLVVQALELQGEVILPSFSFISTAHALHLQGIKPVFCDVDPVSWNIDPEACEALISNRTSAVIGTHLWGRPCDTERFEEIARHHQLPLLFDAAHAFGCTHRGIPVGRFGDAEIFSFHATKAFHTFEGGAVTTRDPNLAERLRKMRNFGFTDYDHVELTGTNAKMTEICAAMGLANLEEFDRIVTGNRRTHDCYREELETIKGLRLLPYPTEERNNFHYIVLEVEESESELSRDELIRILHAENVIARRYFYPGNHRMTPYSNLYPEADARLPQTNRLSQRVMLLPGGAEVRETDARRICRILRLAIENATELRALLESKAVSD